MRYRVLVFSLVFFVSPYLYPQSNDLLFRHFITDDGLSHNTVYAISQDTLGFIWVGTRSGLNRFDGNTFRIYDLNHGLKDVNINTIFRDTDGRLWIGTQEGGLSRYDYVKDRFESWLVSSEGEDPLRANNILSLAEDNRGRIWIGTHEGDLKIFDEETGLFRKIKLTKVRADEADPERINVIHFDSDTSAWLGTFRGLFRLAISPGTNDDSCTIRRVTDTWVTSLYKPDINNLWVGTVSGVILLDRYGNVIKTLSTANSDITSNNVTDIERLAADDYIISTDGGGINIYNSVTGVLREIVSDPNNQQSLSNNSVYEVFVDKDSALWIGNYSGGINYYSAGDWKFVPVKHNPDNPNSLSDNHVRSFYEDSDGNIWLGTPGGLNLYDRKSGKFSFFSIDRLSNNTLRSNIVLSMYEADKDYLWIGTFGAGVILFDRKTKSFSRFSHPDDLNNSLERSSIYQIAVDSKGRVILATLGGIYVIDTTSGRMTRYTSSNSGLSNNTVKAVCRDRNGNFWLGTNYGVTRYNPDDNSFRVFVHSTSDPASLSSNRILSITQASDGNIWIGTEGGGVSIFNPQTELFSSLSSNDGLPDNVINAIAEDNFGNFWFSTNKGLARFDRNSRKVNVYTASDGLQGNDFYQNSCLKTSDGYLYFGGPYGFNSFDPGKMKGSLIPPEIIFTDLFVSGRIIRNYDDSSPIEKQICLVNHLKLPYKSSFEIHFAVPGSPNKNKYLFSYFLEGMSENWSDYLKTSSVNFSNLDPGKYELLVRAMNNDGITSEKPAALRIKISPPWWKTWWVFIIYAFGLGGLLLILLQLNSSKLKARHELQIQLHEREQTEVLNQMKLSFFTDISHEFKTPLTLILGHLDTLKETALTGKNKTITLIESNARRLLMLINQLLEFRKAENGLMRLNSSKGNIVSFLSGIKENFADLAGRKHITLDLVVKGDIPEIWFDNEKMEKVIFNLLSNAFKFTDIGGSIQIEVSLSTATGDRSTVNVNEGVMITVRDTGKGIPPEQLPRIFERFYNSNIPENDRNKNEGSGIGLALSKLLVELHHGKISVRSDEGKGAEFIVFLPVGKDHLSDSEIKEDQAYHLRMDYQTLGIHEAKDEVEAEINEKVDRNKSIMLIIDDNPSICQVLAQKFQDKFSVISASDGKEGIRKARHFLPDIIISDIMMPQLDGFELCNLIKTDISTSHIPIILLTAKSEEEDQIMGYSTGADAYIAKPYNPELLRATVENLLNTRKLLRKKYVDQSYSTSQGLSENKIDNQFINKLVSLIESEKFSESRDVASLCSELGMSRSVMYRKVKMLTDHSIQDFIRMVKLRKAARLLLKLSTPIAEIAFISGFTNTKHFSTAFKKLYGKTPSAYRSSGGV